jgi:hypothetical protein
MGRSEGLKGEGARNKGLEGKEEEKGGIQEGNEKGRRSEELEGWKGNEH